MKQLNKKQILHPTESFPWGQNHLSQFPCAALWCMNAMKVWLLWNGCRSSSTWRRPGSRRSFGCWDDTSLPWLSGFLGGWDRWWCLLNHTKLNSFHERNHCLTTWSNPKQVGKLNYSLDHITNIGFIIFGKHLIKLTPEAWRAFSAAMMIWSSLSCFQVHLLCHFSVVESWGRVLGIWKQSVFVGLLYLFLVPLFLLNSCMQFWSVAPDRK